MAVVSEEDQIGSKEFTLHACGESRRSQGVLTSVREKYVCRTIGVL